MSIKGVVFDFNGTLFWDTKLHNTAWDIFLERYGMTMTDQEKNEKIHGRNNQKILTDIFAKSLDMEEINAFITEKELIYQELCVKSGLKLACGAEEFLGFLRNNNIPYTIATASGLININFFFDILNLHRYFDRAKVIFDDGTMMSKPDPRIYQRAMNILGIKEQETLIF